MSSIKASSTSISSADRSTGVETSSFCYIFEIFIPNRNIIDDVVTAFNFYLISVLQILIKLIKVILKLTVISKNEVLGTFYKKMQNI